MRVSPRHRHHGTLALAADDDKRQHDQGDAAPLHRPRIFAQQPPGEQHAAHRHRQGTEPGDPRRQLFQHEQPEAPGQRRGEDGAVGKRTKHVGLPVDGSLRHQRRHQRHHQGGVDHLPGGEGHQIHRRVAGIHPLGDDGADPPADAGGNAQQRALHGIQVQLPGLDHQQQAASGHPDRQIVQLAHPFTQEERREDHHPERHGVTQNGHLARPAADQRPLGQPHHAAGLEQGDGEGIAKRGRFEIAAAAQALHQQQHQGSAQAAQGGKLERPRVEHHLLHHDPAVTPDGGEQDQSPQRRHVQLAIHCAALLLRSVRPPFGAPSYSSAVPLPTADKSWPAHAFPLPIPDSDKQKGGLGPPVCNHQRRGYRLIRVPVLPAMPSAAFSSRVIRDLRPAMEVANESAASTLGNMEPLANCPCSIKR